MTTSPISGRLLATLSMLALPLLATMSNLSFVNAQSTESASCPDVPMYIRQLELHEKTLRNHGMSSLPKDLLTTSSPADKPLSKISFASCNNQKLSQPMWETMKEFGSDAFFWLGDAVYLDRSNSMFPFIRYPMPLDHMQKDYDLQQSVPSYCDFRDSTTIFGTWDDHDMGENDGHKGYKDKLPAQQMFMDFLGFPSQENITKELLNVEQNSPTDFIKKFLLDEAREMRQREGVYRSRVFGPEGKRVKVILLDIRYHQDWEELDILGPAQWEFLDKEIQSAYAPYGTEEYRKGGAELVIIGSGIQIVSWGKPITEGWRIFPASRNRLLRTISKKSSEFAAKHLAFHEALAKKTADGFQDVNVKNAMEGKASNASGAPRLPPAMMFWSGDIHYAEASQSYVCNASPTSDNVDSDDVFDVIEEDDMVWATPMVEITSSGLTHAWGELPKVSGLPYIGPGLYSIFNEYIPRLLNKFHTEFDISKSHNVRALDIISEYSLTADLKREELEKQGTHYIRLNYATLEFDWESNPADPMVLVSIRNKEGGAGLSYPMPFSFLRPFPVSPLPTFNEMSPSVTDIQASIDAKRNALTKPGLDFTQMTKAVANRAFSWVTPEVAAYVTGVCVAENTVRQTEGYVLQIVTIGRNISYGLIAFFVIIISYLVTSFIQRKTLSARKSDKYFKETNETKETSLLTDTSSPKESRKKQ